MFFLFMFEKNKTKQKKQGHEISLNVSKRNIDFKSKYQFKSLKEWKSKISHRIQAVIKKLNTK